MTDEKILKLYNKEMNFNIKFMNELCLRRLENLSGVVTVGTFAHDLGCMDNRIIIGNRIGDLKKMSRKGLLLCGWKDGELTSPADLKNQSELLLKWTRFLVLINDSPQMQTSTPFSSPSTPDFSKPEVIFENGKWSVSLWVKEAAGMLPVDAYYQANISYDDKGNYLGMVRAERFSVRIEQGAGAN